MKYISGVFIFFIFLAVPFASYSQQDKTHPQLNSLGRNQIKQFIVAHKGRIVNSKRNPLIQRFLDEGKATPGVKTDQEGNLHVVLRLHSFVDASIKKLRDNGLSIERILPKQKVVQGWLPPQKIEAIEALTEVDKIDLPAYRLTNEGSVLTEGDESSRSDQVRTLTGLTGQGIRIGVISDGVNGLFDSVTSDDISSGTNSSCDPNGILQSAVICQSFDSSGIDDGSEGTAMLEIIHDIAPGAQLYFANALTNYDFIDAVNYLAAPEEEGGAGVDIIVDDLVFTGEPFYEDGPVADAVGAVVATAGVIYVTSAGNFAVGHVQEAFNDSDGDSYHNFQTGNDYHWVLIPPDTTYNATLQWNDNFDNATNDLDLYVQLYDVSGNYLGRTYSINNNSGSHPYEYIAVNNTGSGYVYGYILVYRHGIGGTGLEFELMSYNAVDEEYAHAEDSVFGHAALEGVLSVAAIDQADNGQDETESFSSQGPAIVSGVQRSKPDIAAMDGVSITGNGDFLTPFYGTSAAAPHAAACLGLLLQANSSLSPAEAIQIIKTTAVDVGSSGYDYQAGYGRLDCLAAVATYVDIPEEVLQTQGTATDSDQNTDVTDVSAVQPMPSASTSTESEAPSLSETDSTNDLVDIGSTEQTDSTDTGSSDASVSDSDLPNAGISVDTPSSSGCSLNPNSQSQQEQSALNFLWCLLAIVVIGSTRKVAGGTTRHTLPPIPLYTTPIRGTALLSPLKIANGLLFS